MTARDRALLQASVERRLVDAQRHLTALRDAVAGFGSSFGMAEFASAWESTESGELHRAYIVQAGYENVINGVLTAGAELCTLKGWTSSSRAASAIEVLRLLQEHGVIDASVREKLKRAQELRSDIQHDYTAVDPDAVHELVSLLLEAAPLMIQDAALALR